MLSDEEKLKELREFIKEAHSGQMRADGVTSFDNHPFMVE